MAVPRKDATIVKMSVCVPACLLGLLLSARAFGADPSRVFLPDGSFAIDWSIGLDLPANWPPIPTGGPGLRYSFTDDLAVGLQIEAAPLFQRGFAANVFSAWRFWNPVGLPLSGAASVSLLFDASPDSLLWINPRAGLCLGFGEGFVEGYAACDLTAFIINAPVSPLFLAAASLGAVFPRLGNLFLEYRLSDIGIYSSVTRTAFGDSSIALGMMNEF